MTSKDTDDKILDWSVFTPQDIAVKLPNMLDQRPLPEPGQLGIEKWWQQL